MGNKTNIEILLQKKVIDAGGIYRGIKPDIEGFLLYFDDPLSKSTRAMFFYNPREITVNKIKKHLAKVREKFNKTTNYCRR